MSWLTAGTSSGSCFLPRHPPQCGAWRPVSGLMMADPCGFGVIAVSRAVCSSARTSCRAGAVTSVTLQDMTASDVAAWHGWLTHDQGVRYKETLINDVNYSAPILGANRRVLGGARLDAVGNVLWSGYGEATGGVGCLFLNNENLTLSRYPRIRGAHAEALQEDGTFWWYMFDESPSVMRLMRNFEDYSTPVFGDEPHGVIQTDTFVSATGDVLWQGSGAVRGLVTFRNHEDLSTALLGKMNSMDEQIGVGIDRFGNAVWWGSGELTNHRVHVFVNGFGLFADLLGPDHHAVGMAVGENGHVLLVTSEGDMNWIYLSTPVPEPSGPMLLGIGLLPQLRRQT